MGTNDRKEASSVVNIGASLQDKTLNDFSLNLSGDPVLVGVIPRSLRPILGAEKECRNKENT
jgi:hypothetical protein